MCIQSIILTITLSNVGEKYLVSNTLISFSIQSDSTLHVMCGVNNRSPMTVFTQQIQVDCTGGFRGRPV